MMTTASLPRIPVSCQPAENEDDDSGTDSAWATDNRSPCISNSSTLAAANEHDALRALNAAASDIRGTNGVRTRVFSLSLPRPVAAVYGRRSGYRSMSLDASVAMAAITEERAAHPASTDPDSPPSLCDGKSAKSSSSVHSDSDDMSEALTSTDKMSEYDDIAVDDSIDDSNLPPESRPTLKRPVPRSIPTDLSATPSKILPHGDMRSHENRRPRPRPIAPNGVLRDQSLNLPGGRSLRRGYTSPTTPTANGFRGHHQTSRSPSPSKPSAAKGTPVSPLTRSFSATTLSSPEESPGLPRRQSWQPRRKTVKELEDECNDDEEDVPDGAILENVPISPMPGGTRTPRLSSRSNTPSPHRRGSFQTPGSGQAHSTLHSANVPKNAKRPSAPPVLPNGQFGSPRSPRQSRPPMLPHSATVSSFPADSMMRRPRPKSWTEDLNDEARQLSAALEEYADRLSSDKRASGGSAMGSISSSPPRPSTSTSRSMTNILELSKAQKGNIMIDPLPISKEKEAVLTRTRPSWLPPKSQKEERRHVREWEQMMARSAENDRKRALREREARESRDELSDSIARIWDEHVLPNWDAVIREPRTRELWWRGVTPRSRGVVWLKAIGNDLELSPASFTAALGRADALEDKLAALPAAERAASREAAWFEAIRRDAPKVFHESDVGAAPEDADGPRPPFHDALTDVLRAYAMYRSDVGYVYGTHDLAGLLCLHLRAPEAFVALANALNRPMPLAFLVHDAAGMAHAHSMVLGTLKYKFPRLHDHLTSPALGLSPADYLDPLFRRLFAGPPLSPALAARLWDVLVFEGDRGLVRAAVAILGRLEPRLYASREDVLDLLGWGCAAPVELGGEDDFIAAVRDAGKAESRQSAAE